MERQGIFRQSVQFRKDGGEFGFWIERDRWEGAVVKDVDRGVDSQLSVRDGWRGGSRSYRVVCRQGDYDLQIDT